MLSSIQPWKHPEATAAMVQGSLASSLIDRKIWHHLSGDGFANFKGARVVGLWIITLKNQRKLVRTGDAQKVQILYNKVTEWAVQGALGLKPKLEQKSQNVAGIRNREYLQRKSSCFIKQLYTMYNCSQRKPVSSPSTEPWLRKVYCIIVQ